MFTVVMGMPAWWLLVGAGVAAVALFAQAIDVPDNPAGNDKLDPPRPTVGQSQADFERRRQRLLEMIADDEAGLYGNQAIGHLLLSRHIAEANAALRRTAQWFDLPHPRGRDPRGEADFAASKFARAYYLFQDDDRLEVQTRELIQAFFLQHDFQSIYDSENHHLLFRSSRYLMAQAWPDATFEAWNQTGKQLHPIDGDWLKQFIRYRAAHGWGEFDSACYVRPDIEALLNLYDFADDPELRKLSGMMLDLLLADMAVDSIHGMLAGAQGRIYPHQATDHAFGFAYPIQYLYFGNVDPGTMRSRETAVETVSSGYRPRPIVLAIALERDQPYINHERKHLHNMADVLPEHPIPGSIRKITRWTPHYVLGCVQRQDPYPADASDRTRCYAWHQQHDWDLTFGTRTRARLFTHHPGNNNEHNHWTGDKDCGCGRYFQHGPVLLALYDIPKDQPHQSIHAYVPRHALDKVVEKDGWIFVREGEACAALRMIGDYQWTDNGQWAGVEVTGEGFNGRHAVVCEVALASDEAGFEKFQQRIVANPLHFEPTSMELTYRSAQAGELCFAFDGRREVNGQAIDLNNATYDSPFMQSAWGSGVIDLIHGDHRVRLDFG